MTFHVKSGTHGFFAFGENPKMPFITRKTLDFSAEERKKSDPGKLAFRRKGYILIVNANDVTLPVTVHKAIKECLGRLPERVVNTEDRETLFSLASRSKLSTSQAMLAAFLISKHRAMLPGYLWQEATKVFAKQIAR